MKLKIKTINIFIILITIISSIYIAFTKETKIIFILKDLSIMLTINALYIIQKLFKIKISESINFIYILFIFMAQFLGVIINLYGAIPWFDKLMHFLSGIVSSLGAIYILIKTKNKNNLFFDLLFILSFTMFIASLWEVFEYLSSIYFNVDPQKVLTTGVTDTMGDIIVALLGSILVSLSYYYEKDNKVNLFVNKYIKSIEIK